MCFDAPLIGAATIYTIVISIRSTPTLFRWSSVLPEQRLSSKSRCLQRLIQIPSRVTVSEHLGPAHHICDVNA